MKKILYMMILAVTSALFAVSCDTGEGDMIGKEPALKVVSSDLTFLPVAETRTVTLESPSALTATCEQSWLSVSVSGKTLSVSVTENDSNEARYANIVVESAGERVVLSAFQYNAVLNVENFNDVTVERDGGEFSFPYTGNYPPSGLASDVDWITVSLEDSAIHCVVSANTGAEARTGRVSFSYLGNTKSILVTQDGLTLTVEGFVDKTVANSSTVLRFNWTGNTAPENVSVSEDWLSAELTETQIVVTVQANTGAERSATLSYDFVNNTNSITITQEGIAAGPSPYGAYTLNGANTSGTAVSRPLLLTKVSDTQVSIAMTGSSDSNTYTQAAGYNMIGTFPIEKVDDNTYVITWAGGNILAEDFYTGSNIACRIMTCLFRSTTSTAATYRSTDSSVSCEFVLSYDSVSGKFTGTLRNNGSWGSYSATGIGWLYQRKDTSAYAVWFSCPRFNNLQQN